MTTAPEQPQIGVSCVSGGIASMVKPMKYLEKIGGADRSRTDDLLNAIQFLTVTRN
jgi:hypothetical protein